ncbi:putative DD41D transposase [Trichonephila clavipes]|nr:putative DD41D transposase [Trichonephila clavipes]
MLDNAAFSCVNDEAHFWLNGYVNKQNCRIWNEANPQVYVETPLHPEKLTVWCALWAGGIIGSYFFKNDEGHNITVNGDRYRAMITNFFIRELNNHDVQELWFQQDGATCHTARATIDLLKDTFGDRLISRFGPVNWPPRSCDLTPLYYFLWGYVKSLVSAGKPQTLDHLEDNICRVIADIRPQMLEKVIENWTSRLDYIRASRGSHMPEIIFKMKKRSVKFCISSRGSLRFIEDPLNYSAMCWETVRFERCRKIVPILWKPCQIPLILKFVSRIDFTKPGIQDWIWDTLKSSLLDVPTNSFISSERRPVQGLTGLPQLESSSPELSNPAITFPSTSSSILSMDSSTSTCSSSADLIQNEISNEPIATSTKTSKQKNKLHNLLFWQNKKNPKKSDNYFSSHQFHLHLMSLVDFTVRVAMA